MKIKDGIVVSKSDLEEGKRRLTEKIQKQQCIEDIIVSNNTVAIIDKVIEQSKPLDPTILAYKNRIRILKSILNKHHIEYSVLDLNEIETY